MRTDKVNFYHIPYSGNIEQITAQDISKLTANDDGPVAKVYAIQQGRIADARIDDVTVIAPAHAGGLIVKCEAAKREAIYDVVFGGGSVAHEAPRKNNVVDLLPKQQKETSVLSGTFAARAQNDNGVSRAPDLQGKFDQAVHPMATAAMQHGLHAKAA